MGSTQSSWGPARVSRHTPRCEPQTLLIEAKSKRSENMKQLAIIVSFTQAATASIIFCAPKYPDVLAATVPRGHSHSGYGAPQASYGAPPPQKTPRTRCPGPYRPGPRYPDVLVPTVAKPKPSGGSTILRIKLSYNRQRPSYRPPKPSYGPPKPSYGAPKPSYGPPKPSYNGAQNSFSSPQVQAIGGSSNSL